MRPVPHPPPDDARVLLDQVREAVGPPSRWMSSTVAANLVAALLMLVAMHGFAPDATLLGWFALMVCFQLARAALTQAYWRDAPTDGPTLHRWLQRLNAWAVASGAMWGCTGWLFFAPNSVAHQSLLAVLLCALAAGSIPANAMLKWGMQGSALAILTLLMLRLALENEPTHWLMCMMLAVYVVFVLKWGRNLNAVLTTSLQRRHQNLDLIEQLQQQTQAAQGAQRSAEQANLAKSKFLAAASHDLRQPLYALSLFSGAMANETRPARLQALAQHMALSVEALRMLFDALLDISKLDAGVTPVCPAHVELQSLLTRLANDFAPLAEAKGLALVLPPTPGWVHTDPQLLEQILRNLLSNAIRYTDQGQVTLRVQAEGDGWLLTVQDTGIGIAPHEQEQVFEEFYQASNPERDRSKGLGLGLAIVKRVAQLLSLPLTLHSQSGQGTAVTLRVPAAHSLVANPADVAEKDHGLDGLRVLVVDDEGQVRTAVGLLLAQWGCDAVVLESLAEVQAHWAHTLWRPDVALADYRLRGEETGLDVLDWLCAHSPPGLACAIVTGDTAADQLRDITTSGHPLLHKPVPPMELKRLLQRLGPH